MASTTAEEPPMTTAKAFSWFEFLVDPDALLRHLSEENCSPSGPQLMIQLLHRAASQTPSSADSQAPTGEGGSSRPATPAVDNSKTICKVKALKLQAVKIAALNKWDLDYLGNCLPAEMVSETILELLRHVLGREMRPECDHELIDLNTAPDQVIWAVQLYHRWCLRALVRDSLPSKPQKMNSIAVPGLTDPVISLENVSKDKLAGLKLGVPVSRCILEKCLALRRPLVVPTYHSFGTFSDTYGTVKHSFDRGLQYAAEEWAVPIAYDLAQYYFLERNFTMAGTHFRSVSLWQPRVLYSTAVNEAKLEGYCKSCKILLNATLDEPHEFIQLIAAQKAEDWQEVVRLCRRDLLCRRISLPFRQSLENECYTPAFSTEMQILNCVSTELTGIVSLSDLKLATRSEITLLIQVCAEALALCTELQRSYIKSYLLSIMNCHPNFEDVQLAIKDSSSVRALFSAEELEPSHESMDVSAEPKSFFTTEFSSSLSQSEEERLLLTTYDVEDIRRLLMNASSKTSWSQILDKWHLPKAMDKAFGSRAWGFDTGFCYIILAKAKECECFKDYETAERLYTSVEKLSSEITPKLNRLIRWELLYVNLLTFRERLPSAPSQAKLTKRVKMYLLTMRPGSDTVPNEGLVSDCLGFLINFAEYEFLQSLQYQNIPLGIVKIAKLVANLQRTLPEIKASKVPAEHLCTLAIEIFSSHRNDFSSKKQMTGLDGKAISWKVSQFNHFVKSLQDPVVVSAIVSLLVTLYDPIKDHSSHITAENTSIWPEKLINSRTSSLHTESVKECLESTLESAILTCPHHLHFLITLADYHFNSANHNLAMKKYLEAGALSSHSYMEVPEVLFTQLVYRNMIKACTSLKCFTQAAVLCQFLTEIDYALAFKFLQEKTKQDATDVYYDYIWDVTILEFLIYLHNKTGEHDKGEIAMEKIGQLDINTSNPPEILAKAANKRKAAFLRHLNTEYNQLGVPHGGKLMF